MSKRILLLISLLALVALLAACGSSNSSSTNTGSGAAIKTATATVNGTSQTILTNMQGMTLYYFKPDTATTAACTGECVTT